MSDDDIRIPYPTVVRTYSPRVILVHHSRAGSMAFDIFCDGDCPVDPCPRASSAMSCRTVHG